MASTAQTFKEIGQALDGTGIFSGGGALIKYPSETDDQFEKRKEVSWYVNDIRPAAMRFVGYLTKRPPLRQTENAAFQQFLDDCDWRGNSLSVFLQGFMLQAKARGSMLLLIDMPATEQLAERSFPYLTAIAPERVTESQIDEQGRFTRVEFSDLLDGEEITRIWTKDSWQIVKGKDTLASGVHALGVCPVIAFTESGDYPCVGEFAQLVGLSKRLLNLRSELDEILRRHTFPIFSAEFPILSPVDNETADSLQARQIALIDSLKSAVADLGKNRGILSPAPVGFVAPPDSPAKVYRDVIADVEAKVDEIGFNIQQTGEKTAESGLALTIRFQSLNAALVSFSQRMEDFERLMFYVAGLWLGVDAETNITTQWARDYQIADPATELETLGAMMASGFPDEALTAQRKTVAQLLFSNLDPLTLGNILESIEGYTPHD